MMETMLILLVMNGGTPAVGYDFLQGPMVPASVKQPYIFGREISNMKNLQMTSFVNYDKWTTVLGS